MLIDADWWWWSCSWWSPLIISSFFHSKTWFFGLWINTCSVFVHLLHHVGICATTLSKFQQAVINRWQKLTRPHSRFDNKELFPFISLPRCGAKCTSGWGSRERQIQNFADGKSKAAPKDKSEAGNLTQIQAFAVEEVLTWAQQSTDMAKISQATSWNNSNTTIRKHQNPSFKGAFINRKETFLLSEALFAIWDNLWGPDMSCHLQQKRVLAEEFEKVFGDFFTTGSYTRRGLGLPNKDGRKVST